jgi:hypothetical protein
LHTTVAASSSSGWGNAEPAWVSASAVEQGNAGNALNATLLTESQKTRTYSTTVRVCVSIIVHASAFTQHIRVYTFLYVSIRYACVVVYPFPHKCVYVFISAY